MEIKARNVNDAFADVWWRLRTEGVEEDSRNGPVIVAREPTITTYELPQERVLFNAERDANPVFHLVETIWMLAGRNDVESLLPYNANYKNFAEPSGIIHGGYGRRWFGWFGVDQVKRVIRELTSSPTSRRAVISMWDPLVDMAAWKDTPCNTTIYFDLRGGVLNMTVCCRSNDVLWGAYGANVVHFSMLQELIAAALKVEMGVYRQFSNNFHAYTATAGKFLDNPHLAANESLYGSKEHLAVWWPMVQATENYETFLEDCSRFFNNEFGPSLHTVFMRDIVAPLSKSYLLRKKGDLEGSMLALEKCLPCDWKSAYVQWKERRDVSK